MKIYEVCLKDNDIDYVRIEADKVVNVDNLALFWKGDEIVATYNLDNINGWMLLGDE